MDSPDLLSSNSSYSMSEAESTGVPYNSNKASSNENLDDLQDQAIANLQKPNVPNVNIPERLIICLDICYDNPNSVYKQVDGTTFTPMNMLKRVLDFLIHTKNAINKQTEFALILMKNTDAVWVQNFTSNIKDMISNIDRISPEESTSETFDFSKVFNVLKQNVKIPEYKQENSITLPNHVVRMIVIYGRSKCVPLIPQDSYLVLLKKHLYFYIDLLLAHESNCEQYKCVEIFDVLQKLDNGYSYVFEVSKNVKNIHDAMAKLLAHPLQRPLHKNVDYSFGSKHGQL